MTYKQTNTRKREPQQPTYHAYSAAETQDGKGRWTRLGAFFPHEDGQGGNLVLDTLPIQFDGRIVLRAPKAE
ncbi:MAG: hypothetical protein ACJ8AW_03445 [Rhodopila sp.]